ncbi:MAG: SDR family oxidoreductase [Bryobacteraceae bacterium]|nr:SDR family oxidoreductase [Bryobacteraceae bacterium]MDW8380458.1 SDR family oxidoreductase [Bryobacterales bacterium]
MTHITVIGGAGYLGSVLVPALLRHGFAVTVLDNFLFGQNSLLDCCFFEHFRVLRGDCRDEAAVRSAIAGADYIIPLAAIVGAPACAADPTAAYSINLDSIRMLLRLRSKDQRIVSPCTNSGYGIGEKGVECTEETPLKPISIYGVTKVEAERAILDAGNAISLRLATVFGASPRMRLDLLVNDFVYRAVTDRFLVVFEGHFKRNYIHIRDVAKAFLHAIAHFDSMKDQPFNVGLSDANLSKLELCRKIQEQIPTFYYVEAAIGQDPDKRDYIVSNAKIERTGYKPEVSLEMGIAELIKVYAILRAKKYVNA